MRTTKQNTAEEQGKDNVLMSGTGTKEFPLGDENQAEPALTLYLRKQIMKVKTTKLLEDNKEKNIFS